ncbi:zinc-finger homeodomain protein 11-like [Humulus lupulus]|uniref:zinc-finger homeodomain protein 11-like n=1 Tax=Humulus lupulus TaxID=3486 RepID=UPI002B401C2A|nr:zinc-finger homeodomain protein 11-like [Humulus lupulus]
MVQTMDLSPTPTKTTQDTDTETPPPPQATRSLSFSNGPLKLHHRHLNHHAPPPMVVSYRECLKNHAANLGGHALDGCGEFMPCPTAEPSDPTSLKCAACGCHRNFHRRDQPEEPTSKHFLHSFHNGRQFQLHPLRPSSQPRQGRSSSPSLSPSPSSSTGPTPSPQSPPPVSHLPPNSYFASPPQMLLALSTGFSTGPPSDDHHPTHKSFNPTAGVKSSEANYSNAKKRFRTKFNQEQKEKMCLFAEKVGWKMHRSEERLVEEFCKEIGVRRGVLKVWMHNNKHTLGKKDRGLSHSHNLVDEASNGDNTNNEGRVLSFDSNQDNEIVVDQNQNGEDRRANFNFFANGSSSSS